MQERRKRHGFNPWGQEDPLEKGMATQSSIHAWKIRNLAGYSPWGHKESDMTDPLN